MWREGGCGVGSGGGGRGVRAREWGGGDGRDEDARENCGNYLAYLEAFRGFVDLFSGKRFIVCSALAVVRVFHKNQTSDRKPKDPASGVDWTGHYYSKYES